jgi:hypothetical protein
VEIGAEVDAPFAGQGEVLGSTLPAGQVATTTHFSPYDKLGGAHQAIADWCVANNRTWETHENEKKGTHILKNTCVPFYI